MPGFKCDVCDYVYDPAGNDNIPFDQQPEVYSCPDCGAWKEEFKPIG